MAIKCPDCGKLLKPLQTTCLCGYQKKKQGQEYVDDRKCEWRAGELRCPATGTNSASITGGGPWYCRWHFNSRDNFEYSKRVTLDMIKNGVPKKDWREELMQNHMNPQLKDRRNS